MLSRLINIALEHILILSKEQEKLEKQISKILVKNKGYESLFTF